MSRHSAWLLRNATGKRERHNEVGQSNRSGGNSGTTYVRRKSVRDEGKQHLNSPDPLATRLCEAFCSPRTTAAQRRTHACVRVSAQHALQLESRTTKEHIHKCRAIEAHKQSSHPDLRSAMGAAAAQQQRHRWSSPKHKTTAAAA